MRKWLLLLAFVIGLWPAAAMAQSPRDVEGEDVLIRINADMTIAAGDTVENVVVISGNITVDGTVSGTLLVIDGNATISGSVADDVTVISGDVNLLEGATVNNVYSIRGDVTQAPGATVQGDLEESDLSGLWAVIGVFSVLLWVGMTIALIVAGILFALIGGRQLSESAILMTAEPVAAIIGAVVFLIALPLLAVLVMFTIIGLPLGLALLIAVIPALAILGYLVAATRIGMLLSGALNRDAVSDKPILAVVLGVLLMQVVLIIPLLGGLVVFLATVWGTGALLAYAFQGIRGRRSVSTTAATSEGGAT